MGSKTTRKRQKQWSEMAFSPSYRHPANPQKKSLTEIKRERVEE
jgi:hypothetical protein